MGWLFGVITNKLADLQVSLQGGDKTPVENRPNLACGLGWYDGARPRVVKQVVSCQAGDASSPREISQSESRLFIVHLDPNVTGNECPTDLLPFHYRNWLFTHTGNLDRNAFLPLLEKSHLESLNGETSSEAFFHWIMQNIKKTRDLVPSLLDSLQEIPDHALSFLLTNGRWLFAYRQDEPLYYLEQRFSSSLTRFEYLVPDFNAVIKSNTLGNESFVLVAAQQLSDQAWTLVPDGHLLVVTPQLELFTIDLAEKPTSSA